MTTPASAAERFELERLRPDDADELAVLHVRVMQGYFLSLLGRGILRRFYREFCRHSFDFGVVARCRATRRLAGFVVGTSDAAAHFRSFYRRHVALLAVSLLFGAVCRREVRQGLRRRIGHLWFAAFSLFGRARRGPASPTAPGAPPRVCPVRLLSIAVAPEFRGTGVSGLVAAYFEETLRQAGISRVGLSVHADNERAIAFYRKAGWNETYRSDAGLWFEKSI